MGAVKDITKQVPAVRHVADGRVFVREFTPVYETKSAGGIVLTETFLAGKASISKNGQVITPDKSVICGVVTGCGIKTERQTCKPIPDEHQGEYPLPVGTILKASRSSADHCVSPGEIALNTWDVLEYVLPTEPRPSWAPKEV